VTRVSAALALVLLLAAGTASAQVATATQPAPAAPERIAEIRVHGNHTTPEAEVLKALGLAVGQTVDDVALEAAASRLRKSGLFERVEIRKRSRSLEPGGDVALVVVVQERPLPDAAMSGPAALKPFRRLWNSGMLMPILRYDDGYGFTYGARISAVDWPTRGNRFSAPLSWGGTKRAALEYERTLSKGPFDRIFAAASASRRTNPFYEIDEEREEVTVEASKRLTRHVSAAGRVGYANVAFGAIEERTLAYGANLSLDTSMDPVFPRNAVVASAGWERLDPDVSAAVDRFDAGARGYLGLVGQSVLAIGVQYAGASGTQPDYARYLLGGIDTLRGYAAGSFAGDNLLAGSIELRIPLTSPMGLAKAGVRFFADAGTVWDHGQEWSASSFKTGVGVGGFLVASLFQASLDVGFREGGDVRVHFAAGVSF
jgi:outer membrane protein assembly factor BamA